jgi:integrase
MPRHLRKRAGVWHYSRIVPHDVRPVLRKKYWRFTLGTSKLREAEAQCAKWDWTHQEAIDRIRSLLASPETLAVETYPGKSIQPVSSQSRKLEAPPPGHSSQHNADAVTSMAASDISILNALEMWLAENKQKPSTVVKYRLYIRRLSEFGGKPTVRSLTASLIEKFVASYSRLPNARALNLAQRKLGMPQLLALRATNTSLPLMGAVNVRKMVEYLRAFLRALGRDDLIRAAKKPKDDRPHAERREGYASLKPDKLALVLSAVEKEYGRNSDISWWVWLLAFTGMRPEEAAQLSRDNIHREGAIWAIKIDDLDHRRVKNAQSLRTIPVHPALLRRGFIEFAHPDGVASGLLFQSFDYDDKGGRSNNPSRRLKVVLNRLGIDGKGSAHRFRPSFIDALRNAGVSYSIELGLVGHSDQNRIHGRYGDGASLKAMSKALRHVKPIAPVNRG